MTINYKTYTISKAYEIVLRRAPTNKVMRPFYRVHIDLFPEIVAYNGYIWTIYFYDEFLRINKVETFAYKSSSTQAVIRYLNRVEH